MFKPLLAGLVFLAFAAPAFAGSACNDADRKTLQADIVAMPDGAEKTAAMKEWDMSTASMAANNTNDCDSHMAAAKTHTGKK